MKLRSKFLLIGAMLTINTACTTIKTNELSAEEAVSLTDKTVVYSKYKSLPDFAAQTAVNVQFGLLGVATAISNGNKMILTNDIEDPALEISKQLADGLKVNHNVKVVEETDIFAQTNDLSELLSLYQGYDYILDVKTLGWNSIYYTSDWDSYRVFYTAHARLIDTGSKEVVVEVLCASTPEYEDTNQGPSYEELENGEGLRKELGRSVEFCVDHIRTVAMLKYQSEKKDLDVVMAE